MAFKKLGFAECKCAQMLKELAKAVCDWHDGKFPINYEDLMHLPGIDDRAATLYLIYSVERFEVSLGLNLL